MITKSDFVFWKNLDITQSIFKALEEEQQYLEQKILNLDLEQNQAVVKLAKLKGIHTGLQFLLDITFEDEENND